MIMLKPIYWGMLIGLIFISIPGYAKDLGIKGKTWEILEPDIREAVAASAGKVNWTAINDGLTKQAENFTANLIPADLPKTTKATTRWVDPSVTLQKDVHTLVKSSSGTWEKQVMYKKGTKVNPLNYTVPFDALFFVDGRDAAQRKFATSLLRRYPNFVRILLTAGDPSKFTDAVKIPIFYAPEQIIQKFGVTATPTLIYAGQGAKKGFLGVSTFDPRGPLAQVNAVWKPTTDLTPSSRYTK